MAINVGLILGPRSGTPSTVQMRPVPDVVGLREAAALDVLIASGLRVLRVIVEGLGSPGIVAAQAPPAGAVVRRGTPVAVYVPSAPTRRPAKLAPEPDVVLTLTYADPDVVDVAAAAVDDGADPQMSS